MKHHLEYIEGKTETYLQQMDVADKAEEKAEIEEKTTTQKQRKCGKVCLYETAGLARAEWVIFLKLGRWFFHGLPL